MSEHLHHLATSGSVAAPWPPRSAPRFAVSPAEAPARDHIPDEILAALRACRIFDIGSAAVVGHAGIEGRVRVRIDDGRWSLATLEASVIALLLTVEADLPHADLFAAAFRRAAVDAECKVMAVHALAEGVAA